MKVYIVYSYAWPDFDIEAVFFDEQLAKEFKSKQDSPAYYGIEEWEGNTYKVHTSNFDYRIEKV
jgi:hypothetical protein